MKKETAIRIAALFDGEVDSVEKAELQALIARDPEAKAYWDELEHLSGTLQGAHVSSTRSGASWEAIRQQINKPGMGSDDKVLHFPKYATAAAALVALGIGIWYPSHKSDSANELELSGLDDPVYMVETDLENATPVVYIDEPSGWTVVWVVEADAHDPVDG